MVAVGMTAYMRQNQVKRRTRLAIEQPGWSLHPNPCHLRPDLCGQLGRPTRGEYHVWGVYKLPPPLPPR